MDESVTEALSNTTKEIEQSTTEKWTDYYFRLDNIILLHDNTHPDIAV